MLSGGDYIIDLRSDTLTKPTKEMRKAMFEAEVGDDGREDNLGRGEDPTVNRLEDIAAEVSGKKAALFCNSGAMANLIALLTHCTRGDNVLLGETSHINKSEKAPFMDSFGGLIPRFFVTDPFGTPEINSIKQFIGDDEIKLLCLENTNNFMGGTCMSKEQTKAICHVAHEHAIPVHLDGARIFNASVYYDIPVKKLVEPVDSLMLSLSKGLGAPVGALLCGEKEFISRARKVRKLLGGSMRQSGVVAASGISAIQQEADRLKDDHDHAYRLANMIMNNDKIDIRIDSVQTNMIVVDVSPSGQSAETFESGLLKRGLKVKSISDRHVRMTTYREITRDNMIRAANIINSYCDSL
ncbi:GntG family PLP-dependent aldolase [Salicibibacter kimchii]|uniref:Aminotransferase class I/II-fold pyridoxal phosphate-dependent enzyme n=1 Tax=Salicibibacter kimchii TaxID=2099786 RepID=A0A345C2W0_9BACI|nr:GntG family PLP-dependent aldolase [Salicibibacter kimchii]AXF57541.1 aminotransferase class I/II-fold pyridoxal phosphate-dependent enzyme [Salicibibacter kimchii]